MTSGESGKQLLKMMLFVVPRMLMISRDTIDEVKARIDIIDVISDFVSLKKSGNSYKALSPFTNEKSASFFVVPSKGIFKDFSSGKGGDAITFVMEHEGMSYLEAIRMLAKKYGVEIREDENVSDDKSTVRDSLYIINNFAKDYYHDLLEHNEEGQSIGKSYFVERGFSEAIIRQFELGYSLKEWDAFTEKALSSGYSEEMLEKAGLTILKEGGKRYDRFRGRVIFPVHNLAGKVIAFGGRILTKEKEQPKYVNSPETDVYQKSRVLYGMYFAKNAIRKEDSCFLVEGYTDVLSMRQGGIENVVASSGTALTEDQISLMRRFTENVTVLFDGDEAGMKAALRGVDLILKGGLNVKVVVLPDGEDPDSFARKRSSTELKNYLQSEAKDFLNFKIDLFSSEIEKDPIKKAELIRDLVGSISVIPDALKRSVYVQECSVRLKVPAEIIAIEIKKLVLSKRTTENKSEEKDFLATRLSEVHELSRTLLVSPEETLQLYERELIKVLMLLGHLKTEDDHFVYDVIFTETDDVKFVNTYHAEIFDFYRSEIAQGHTVEPQRFVNVLPAELRNYLTGFIVNKYEISEGWKKHKIYVGDEYNPDTAPYKAIWRLKLGIVQKMLHENLEKLKTCADSKEEAGLMDVQFGIDKYKNLISSELGIHVFPT